MQVTEKLINQAAKRLEGISRKTILQLSKRLSEKYNAQIYLKREDLQEVRSFKIRGAYNKIATLTEKERKQGVVCASSGNHAQGVAFSCFALKIKGVIFMPETTPMQKINKVKKFGGKFVKVELFGTTFDEAYKKSIEFCKKQKAVFVHPFNDEMVIAGQGTVAKEVYEELEGKVDVVVSAIGGGGLISGLSSYLKAQNKDIDIIGVEPLGAAAMYEAVNRGKVVTLQEIDHFVDGAAVKTVGDKTYNITKKLVDKVITIPEGKVCSTMIDLYQDQGIVAEPAGALSVSALDKIVPLIKGKTVVCILSGGNNDVLRYPEVLERSLIYQGRKHYFIINFAQKPGELKHFLEKALGKDDDIVRFEYVKKTNAERGPAFIGVELKSKDNYKPLIKRMEDLELDFEVVEADSALYHYLV